MLILQRLRGGGASNERLLPSNRSQRTAWSTTPEVTRHESVLVALRREDREFLRKLLALFLIVFVLEWAAAFWFGPQPPEVIRGDRFQQSYRIDINTATWVEWLQLDGIGPALAHRLEVDRQVNGPYSSIDDLRRVSGIGPSILEQIRPWLIEPCPDSVGDPVVREQAESSD